MENNFLCVAPNVQDLILNLCEKLAVVLEVIMTLHLEKGVEIQMYQFVQIQINASSGMEFI